MSSSTGIRADTVLASTVLLSTVLASTVLLWLPASSKLATSIDVVAIAIGALPIAASRPVPTLMRGIR